MNNNVVLLAANVVKEKNKNKKKNQVHENNLKVFCLQPVYAAKWPKIYVTTVFSSRLCYFCYVNPTLHTV